MHTTIFISYARENAEAALRLFNDLKRLGTEPWLDSESLLPGQEWKIYIARAIRETRYFLALLSTASVTKKGMVQKELRDALEMLAERPEGDIFIIPARIDECYPTHSKLHDLHWVDLFPSWETGLTRIARLLQTEGGKFGNSNSALVVRQEGADTEIPSFAKGDISAERVCVHKETVEEWIESLTRPKAKPPPRLVRNSYLRRVAILGALFNSYYMLRDGSAVQHVVQLTRNAELPGGLHFNRIVKFVEGWGFEFETGRRNMFAYFSKKPPSEEMRHQAAILEMGILADGDHFLIGSCIPGIVGHQEIAGEHP